MLESMENQPSLLVVLDTNKWYGHNLLKSAIGNALIYAVGNLEAKIGLPEVVRRETISRCERGGLKAVDEVEESLNTIKKLTGEAPDPPLPDKQELRQKVRERLDELANLLSKKEPTLEHYEKSLDKTVFKRAPSEDGNGFRDCLIWEAVLDWTQNTKVVLITGDGDFYDNNNKLHPELKTEIQEVGGDLEIYRSIESFLSSLEQEITEPDSEKVSSKINQGLEDELYKIAEKKGFDTGDLQEYDLNYFQTQSPEDLAVDFYLEYFIFNIPISGEGKRVSKAQMLVSGSCKYSKEEEEISDIQLEEIKLQTLSGEKIFRQVIGRTEPVVIGTKIEHYSSKASLKEYFSS